MSVSKKENLKRIPHNSQSDSVLVGVDLENGRISNSVPVGENSKSRTRGRGRGSRGLGSRGTGQVTPHSGGGRSLCLDRLRF